MTEITTSLIGVSFVLSLSYFLATWSAKHGPMSVVAIIFTPIKWTGLIIVFIIIVIWVITTEKDDSMSRPLINGGDF